MMIRWSDNVNGQNRNQSFLIRGQQFLNNVVSITSASGPVASTSFGVTSFIDDTGQGLSSSISNTLGLLSFIDDSGQGIISLISADGTGLGSDI